MNWLIRIRALAANTVREAIRDRVLYTLLFFAILMIATGVLLSTLSYIERERILQDVGLAAIRLFGAAIAIFVGIGLIHKEVDRRTIYTILSKPISRSEFLFGKYAGLVAIIWLQIGIMAVAFAAVSAAAGAPLDLGYAAALALSALELALVVAVATLFSCFTTPMLAAFYTTGVYVVGHLTRDLRDLGANSSVESVQQLTAFLYRVLPDLESFNLTIHAVHGLPISASDLWLPLFYAGGYITLVLMLAMVIFERRDFR